MFRIIKVDWLPVENTFHACDIETREEINIYTGVFTEMVKQGNIWFVSPFVYLQLTKNKLIKDQDQCKKPQTSPQPEIKLEKSSMKPEPNLPQGNWFRNLANSLGSSFSQSKYWSWKSILKKLGFNWSSQKDHFNYLLKCMI